ncbi:MAG: peptidoglycan-binding protein, partial [Patescibacteria group bacterium]|nr:peptidoglycan-binding protein [Patescibacteria group bacterium]
MKKVLISLAAGLAFFASTVAPASAATLTSAQVQAVVSLLQAFGVDATTIANVQNTLNGVQVSTPATTTASTTAPFTSNMIGFLRLGDKGDGVKLLQTMLAADPSVYPQGIISGFFGPMTAEALKLYQQKHGLERVGFIGPKTLHDLDDDLNQNQITTGNGNASSTVSIGGRQVCAIVPPGHLIAPGWLRHHEGEDLVIPPCQTLPPGIEDRYHEGEGTTTPPIPDTTAPVISQISVGDLTASG